ncbi:nuclear transport factor 2 family protein [Zavarzinia sp.]|uniref:nuclear transport factor 2 family protein n=1 Tax=Zavarzinia sp. TaxID=2027920 RepID=UPI0035635B96
MTHTIESLAQRIQELEDLAAIHTLKHRYWRACDHKKPDDMRACFTPEAQIDAAFMGVHDGRDSFVNLFSMIACNDQILDMHHGQNPVIRLDGPDKARGTWDLYFNQINLMARSVAQVGGFYEDDYVKVDGQWLIAASTFRVTSTLMLAVDDEGGLKTTMFGR